MPRAVPARVPLSHLPAPLGTRAASQQLWGRVSVPSLLTWAHVGVWDRQTDRKPAAPKGQAQLESGNQQLGASCEQPLSAAPRVVCAGVGGGSVALELWLMRVRVSGKWLHPHLAPVAFILLFYSPGAAAMPGLCRAGRGAGLSSGGFAQAGFGSRAGFPDVSVHAGAGRLLQGETPAVLHIQSQPGRAPEAFSWDVSASVLGNIWHMGIPQHHLLACSKGDTAQNPPPNLLQ